mmetsp:Transcript_22006/g.19561  ORF Transcript_22006/g.19561 Transcript_22006/m.19561 type:complete len:89 (+) Transcript_22006:200-466(+)
MSNMQGTRSSRVNEMNSYSKARQITRKLSREDLKSRMEKKRKKACKQMIFRKQLLKAQKELKQQIKKLKPIFKQWDEEDKNFQRKGGC